MEQENNSNIIICPVCKSENPAISVCLNCRAKLQKEEFNAKNYIPRPLFVTLLAVFSLIGFIRYIFRIYDAENLETVPILMIFAGLNILMAYGLWQLKKWARKVVIIDCVFTIAVLWMIPFVIWFVPYEGIKNFFESLSVDISRSPLRMPFMKIVMYKVAVFRAVVGSGIKLLILGYFYSDYIKEVFSDRPRWWRGFE